MYNEHGEWEPAPTINYNKPIQDSKIPLIKWVREHHNLHLRDAKDVVERFLAEVIECELTDDEAFVRQQRDFAIELLDLHRPAQAQKVLQARTRAALREARFGR